MAQSKPCVICLTPVLNHATLRCCGQPCHAGCAIASDKPYTKQSPILTCPSCQHAVPLSVLEVTPLQRWKEDPEFVKQVKEKWKDNPLWYGICYEDDNVLEGFWGELRDPYETHRKTLYFLGQTKSQAIQRMITCMSFS